MARQLGPKHRLCRRVGQKLCDADKCPVTRRNYPPGVHGPKGHRPKITEYGTQLLEKQKAKAIYGLLEKQFRSYFDKARSRVGNTSVMLQQLLERRLDNVAFRLALSKTRQSARQAITHGHITVNGKRVTIPSYQIKVGDVVGVNVRSQKSALFQDYPTIAKQTKFPEWIASEPDAFQGRVLRVPEAKELQLPFNAQSIVEFYSR